MFVGWLVDCLLPNEKHFSIFQIKKKYKCNKIITNSTVYYFMCVIFFWFDNWRIYTKIYRHLKNIKNQILWSKLSHLKMFGGDENVRVLFIPYLGTSKHTLFNFEYTFFNLLEFSNSLLFFVIFLFYPHTPPLHSFFNFVKEKGKHYGIT